MSKYPDVSHNRYQYQITKQSAAREEEARQPPTRSEVEQGHASTKLYHVGILMREEKESSREMCMCARCP